MYLSKIKDKKIFVVGDVMLDKYLFGKVERISPEAPVPIVEIGDEDCRLGGAANVAKNLVDLGIDTTLISITGTQNKDDMFKMVDLVKQAGIKNKIKATPNRKTTTKTRIIAHDQQMMRIDNESRDALGGNLVQLLCDTVSYAVQDELNNDNHVDAIIISDYAKGIISERVMRYLMTFCRQKGIFLSVDPKQGHFGLYKNVNVITPNLKEYSWLAGYTPESEQEILKSSKRVFETLNIDMILVTRGADGMTLIKKNKSHNEEAFSVKAVAQNVYDVTGAGDTVISVFTACMVSGFDAVESMEIANIAAGHVVSKIGAASITLDELDNLANRPRSV